MAKNDFSQEWLECGFTELGTFNSIYDIVFRIMETQGCKSTLEVFGSVDYSYIVIANSMDLENSFRIIIYR